jgi:hypothetical protein
LRSVFGRSGVVRLGRGGLGGDFFRGRVFVGHLFTGSLFSGHRDSYVLLRIAGTKKAQLEGCAYG